MINSHATAASSRQPEPSPKPCKPLKKNGAHALDVWRGISKRPASAVVKVSGMAIAKLSPGVSFGIHFRERSPANLERELGGRARALCLHRTVGLAMPYADGLFVLRKRPATLDDLIIRRKHEN